MNKSNANKTTIYKIENRKSTKYGAHLDVLILDGFKKRRLK